MNSKMKYPLVGLRGRAYECAGCHAYRGERSMVQSHYYNNHVKPENVPFRCKLCNFKSISEKTLEQHVTWYKDHKTLVNRRKADGQTYKDNDIMIKSESPIFLQVDKELLRLDTKTSEEIWEARKRKPRNTTSNHITTEQDTNTTTATPMNIIINTELTTMPAALITTDTSSTAPMPTLPELQLPTSITAQQDKQDDTIDLIDQLLATIPEETSQFYNNEHLSTDPLSLQTTSPLHTPTYVMPEPSDSPQTTSNPTRRVIQTNTTNHSPQEQMTTTTNHSPQEQMTTTTNSTQEHTSTTETTHVTRTEYNQLLEQHNRTNQLLEAVLKQLEDNNKYVYWLGRSMRGNQQTTQQHMERILNIQERTLQQMMQQHRTYQPPARPRNQTAARQRTLYRRHRTTTRPQNRQDRDRSRSPSRC